MRVQLCFHNLDYETNLCDCCSNTWTLHQRRHNICVLLDNISSVNNARFQATASKWTIVFISAIAWTSFAIKLSYSCMSNMSSFIKQHDHNILSSPPKTEERSCNCRNKDNCPLAGRPWKHVLFTELILSRNTHILWRLWWRVQVLLQQSHKFVS